jgi:hypothetical protein
MQLAVAVVLDRPRQAMSAERAACRMRTTSASARSWRSGKGRELRERSLVPQSVCPAFEIASITHRHRLVLPEQPQGHQAPHRGDRVRNLCDAAQGATDSDSAQTYRSRWSEATCSGRWARFGQSARSVLQQLFLCCRKDRLLTRYQIIPIAHHPTLLSIPADDAMSIISELESYKSALRACYASYGAVPVTFEVGRLTGRGGHAHVQIVPVPQDLTSKVADAFRIAGEKQGLDWEVEPERALARVGSTGNYFKVECRDQDGASAQREL